MQSDNAKTEQTHAQAAEPRRRKLITLLGLLGVLGGAIALDACGGQQEDVANLAQASSPAPPPPSLAKVLSYGFVPEFAHGTLAISQPPVNIVQTPQGILGSVNSQPLISIGPNRGTTPPLSHAPGGYGAGTAYFLVRGYFHLKAVNVTTPGTVTLDLQQKPLGLASFGSFDGSSGISQPSIHLAINSNSVDYFVPIEVANAGEPGNATYGTFDVFVSQTGVVADTLQVIAGGLQVMAWPTNTTVASFPQVLDFVAAGQESQLLWNQ